MSNEPDRIISSALNPDRTVVTVKPSILSRYNLKNPQKDSSSSTYRTDIIGSAIYLIQL
jgi:hypothetical protein